MVDGKVAIVTGGSRGIGKAISLALSKEGAQVIVNYRRSASGADHVVEEINSKGGRSISYQADVTKESEAEQMVEDTVNHFGRVDILVNNAGVIRDKLLLTMTEKDWCSVIDVNLGGVFHCTRAVAKHMTLQKSGRIINISSIGGERGGRGHCNYAASKGGINAFTKSMAIELAPKGITVNAVSPGIIVTEMSAAVRRRTADGLLSQIPLGRYGTTADVANVVLFLASEKSSYITGEIIGVTGGFGV